MKLFDTITIISLIFDVKQKMKLIETFSFIIKQIVLLCNHGKDKFIFKKTKNFNGFKRRKRSEDGYRLRNF